MKQIIISLRILLVLTVLTGVVYPVVITLIAQFFFHDKANGSLLSKDGKIIGSELIGQKFLDSTYFWPRPSAVDYNPLPSGASNQGPTNKDLQQAVEERRKAFMEKNGLPVNTVVPTEMLFASGSGLDPHISPAAAYLQISRISGWRHIPETELKKLVDQSIEERSLGFLGDPVVNVLKLNMSLDRMH